MWGGVIEGLMMYQPVASESNTWADQAIESAVVSDVPRVIPGPGVEVNQTPRVGNKFLVEAWTMAFLS